MAELKKLQENGVDIYPVTLEDVVFDSNGNTLPSKYQTKTDSALNTTDKTIVGAINELFQCGTNVKQNLVDTLVAKGVNCSTSDSFDTLIGYISTLGKEEIGDIWKSMTNMISSTYNLAGAESINDKIYCIGNSLNFCYSPLANTWETKTQSSTTRVGFSTCVANQKIYCLGGLNASNGDYLNTNEYYDPITNTWTTKCNMPYQMANFSSSSVDNLIYATGGYKYGQVENNNTNFCYSPSTDTWTTKCNMNYQRLYHTSSVSNNMIYVFGGETGSIVSDTCECYNISTNTWTTKATMPIARRYLTSSTVNNKIYVIGGNSSNGATSLNYCYSPSTNTWEKKKSMLSSKYSCHSAVINNEIYVIGGYDVNNNKLSTNERYTPNGVTSIETTSSMPTWITNRWIQSSDISRTLIAAGIIGYGDYIYILGGNIPPNSSDGSGSYTSIDTVVRFNTKTGEKTTMANAIEASNYQGKVVLKDSKIYTVANNMYCYDINSNSWSTFATETGMYSSLSACCIIGNNIYMTGGYERMYDNDDNYLGDNSPRNYCYNILTKTYTEKATMTLGRYSHTCSIVDSKIYVIGGEIDSYYTKTIECYDPSTNTWTQKTDMPSDKYRHVAEAIGTNIYVIGGNNINASNQSANYCYNTLTNTWTTKSAMPVSREYAFSAISNGWIYVMGGMWRTTAYKTNYCYIP